MLWLILSLLTALAVASQDAWVKKHFSHLTADDMLAFPFMFSLPLFFIHCLAHGLAISMVTASYMISVKKLSALIGIIYGRLFFKEKYIAVRFAGCRPARHRARSCPAWQALTPLWPRILPLQWGVAFIK